MAFSQRDKVAFEKIKSKAAISSLTESFEPVLLRHCFKVETSADTRGSFGDFSGSFREFVNVWPPSQEVECFRLTFQLYKTKESYLSDCFVCVDNVLAEPDSVFVVAHADDIVLTDTLLVEAKGILSSFSSNIQEGISCNVQESLSDITTSLSMQKVMVYTPDEEKAESRKQFTRQQVITIVSTVIGSIFGAVVGAIVTFLLMK